MSRRNVRCLALQLFQFTESHSIAKDVMPQYIDAYGFITGSGAMLCFGCLLVVYAKEK
jgi:hypothetical protein